MPKKRIKNKHLTEYILIISSLFIIFLIVNSFPKKLNNIIKNNYQSRLIEIYGYCSRDSYGFLQMVNNKYNIKKNPIIINYKVLPNSIWTIYSASKKFDIRPTIFLNYPENLNLVLFPNNNKVFVNKNHIQFSNGIKSISFVLKQDSIRLDNNITVYKIPNSKKIEIFKKKINQTITSGEKIDLNFTTENINSRWEKIYLEINNLDKNIEDKIVKIELQLEHKYDLSKFQILEKFENCYFIK
jgi:hypothetical protein